ncbi:hypothetical protein GCM10010507_50690 [Streptomyces cinnamoneus]|uniref:Uncharacterized protein n=1 Tax=Streptomyces cinnamoneus TaxID=53446 RepID=A0A918WR75_STRCJ|nr:hypothetical protein GCM10010507_50690 [Streptomyces cinnamoneus]
MGTIGEKGLAGPDELVYDAGSDTLTLRNEHEPDGAARIRAFGGHQGATRCVPSRPCWAVWPVPKFRAVPGVRQAIGTVHLRGERDAPRGAHDAPGGAAGGVTPVRTRVSKGRRPWTAPLTRGGGGGGGVGAVSR